MSAGTYTGTFRTHDRGMSIRQRPSTCKSRDEALEGDVSSHAESCDSCKAVRAHGTKDAHMLALRKLNARNRAAYGQR